MPGARCTGGLACKIAKKRTRAYRFSGGNPTFPAQWFYGLLRALPGDQACLTPSSARLIADLTPASGRQNDTTWPYASAPSSKAPTASTASRPTLMTLRNAPLKGRDRRISELIWVRWQAKFSEFRKLIGRPFPGSNSSLRGTIATKQSILIFTERWIASLALAMTGKITVRHSGACAKDEPGIHNHHRA